MNDNTVTAHFPEQVFSPAPYKSFKWGGLTFTTEIRQDETREEAQERANKFLEAQVKQQARDMWRLWKGLHAEFFPNSKI